MSEPLPPVKADVDSFRARVDAYVMKLADGEVSYYHMGKCAWCNVVVQMKNDCCPQCGGPR